MKLCEIQIENARGVPDGRFAFADRATGAPLDVILITGGPASGKTALLEAIAVAKETAGSYGPHVEPATWLRPGKSSGRIEACWTLSESERLRAGLDSTERVTVLPLGEATRAEVDPGLRRLFATYSRDPHQGKFEYFPANRRLSGPSWKPPAAPSSEAAEGRLRLTRDPDKYAGLRRLFHDLTLADASRLTALLDAQGVALRTQRPDSLAPFKEAIAALLPDLRLAAVELGERGPRIWFLRRDGRRVELDELSESEQQGVLFAVTFQRLGLHHSVILIDSPELHLHPREHSRFVGRLLELGRGNQIIAATTSTELLKSVRPEQVIDLDAT